MPAANIAETVAAALAENPRAMTMQLSQKLGLRSVAEGIEKEEEWALLKSLGCDLAQGYFIARPMPGDAVPEWHQSWTAGM